MEKHLDSGRGINFDAIAEAAFTGEPQYIKPASHQDLVLTAQTSNGQKESCEKEPNMNFIEFLLSAPQGDWEFAPEEDTPKVRDIEL